MSHSPVDPNDLEFKAHVIEKTEASSSGWSVTMGNGWSIFVPIDRCAVGPAPGEGILLYGKGIGYPVRGIVVAGRVYSYETPVEHEASQSAMRERLTRESDEADERFRAAPKPALAAFKVNDEAAWAECVKVQSANAYSFAALKFAAAWASLMEQRGELGDVPNAETTAKVAQIANTCSREADTEGITGFMYGCAVSCLAKLWVHGEALRRWHNKDAQIGSEGERECGVLNPALLSIGGPT